MAPPIDRNGLPDYERPPVVETVLGVQFESLPKFTNAHLGTFWETLPSLDWPHISDAPFLPSQFERFTDPAKWAAGVRIQLTQSPAARLQIKNRDESRMIQVQNGRLHFNWLGKSGDVYPRYERVKAGFSDAWQGFSEFVDRADLGVLQPNQWEVTYINQIPRGTVWNTPNDWGFFKPLACVPTIEGVAEAESFTGEWHFVIPNEQGRLHIEWQHGLRAPQGSDKNELVQLTLTARGPLNPKDDQTSLLSGLDLGHRTIVETFRDLMSDQANNYWELKNANG